MITRVHSSMRLQSQTTLQNVQMEIRAALLNRMGLTGAGRMVEGEGEVESMNMMSERG